MRYIMKKTKKILISLAAGLLATTSAATLITKANQVHAVETAEKTQNAAEGMLTLNHKTRVYNKKGQKRYSYLGCNGLLKNGSEVKYAGTVEAINNPDVKRYSFHDNDWNWLYLPYKIIKGKEYFSIGHGGYIKAVNVGAINGQPLYTDGITTTTKAWSSQTNVPVYDNQGNKTSKKLKIGQKVALDRQANIFDLTEKGDGYNGGTNFYRLKGSNDFINRNNVKNVKHFLPEYTNYTRVLFVNDAYLYNTKGEKIIEKDNKPLYHKGDGVTVTSMVNITDKVTGETVPFYRLADQYLNIDQKRSNECYIKASDTKIMWGKQLEPTKLEVSK